jgi:hypothetical protein
MPSPSSHETLIFLVLTSKGLCGIFMNDRVMIMVLLSYLAVLLVGFVLGVIAGFILARVMIV